MKYDIKGGELPVVICNVEPGETLVTERGSMCWMSPNMKMETVGGGAGKVFGRMFSGESLFQNRYTAQGNGMIAFYYDPVTSIFGRVPLIFIPTLLAVAVFLIYDHKTAAGRKGKVLSNNQNAGVNIGIDEKKNVLVSYVFSGIIIGLAATIYVSQNAVVAQSGLSTSGILFSYIVPVFMGTFIGLASNDVIGICIAAIGLSIMNYGLNCLNLGAGGWQQIILGVFVLGFYAFEAKSHQITKLFAKLKKTNREAA